MRGSTVYLIPFPPLQIMTSSVVSTRLAYMIQKLKCFLETLMPPDLLFPREKVLANSI